MYMKQGEGHKLEIYLNARGLGDLDFFSKSDPFVKVFFGKSQQGKWNYVGRTQTINNQLNPNWTKTFVLNYLFQTKQPIRFQVCDDDGKDSEEAMGSVQSTLGSLAGARCQTSFLDLAKGNKGMGKLVVRCQKASQDSSEFINMKWKALKVMNTDSMFDWWNKSDPYLKFLKIRSDNSLILAGQTEVISNSLNPSWNTIQISLTKLANNKGDKFKIECWDREPDDKPHQFIGEVFISAIELQPNKEYVLHNPKHSQPGVLILESLSVVKLPQFLDYLRGGLRLNLTVAIDFTGSNGSPTSKDSLHYMGGTEMNQYQSALRQIGDILLSYDSDQSISAFGFGAKPKYPNFTQTVAHHCFPLSGDFHKVDATSMEHLKWLYSYAIQHTEFAGPTYFHPLMTEAFSLAQQTKNKDPHCYQILLVLTDGQIHDMDQTVNLIYSKSDLPMSIIIVGVGNADFGNMNKLDGDNGLFNSKGEKAPRDIVQFVPFRQMNHDSVRLASELLMQLPSQIVQYMVMSGIKPGQALNMDFNKLLEGEMMKKDTQGIANMFKQAGFLDKFVQSADKEVKRLQTQALLEPSMAQVGKNQGKHNSQG